MRKYLLVVLAFLSAAVCAETPKNVILFIGDGMSVPQRMVAEEFSRKLGTGPLVMNALPYSATTRTCSANSLVTDSAAAATAIACGEKTNNHYTGVDPNGKPVYSCAVAAKKAGKKVGICTNVTITHATPAGFYAHRNNRGDTYGIALDLADSGFDFFAGGGLDVTDGNAKRHPQYGDHGDAYAYAQRKGYRLVTTLADFLALKPGDGKILTRFTNGPLEPAIDFGAGTPSSPQPQPIGAGTPSSPQPQPTVAQLTSKALEVLDNPQGFFLMVEGGRIDWAGHANDAATNLRDVLALDAAVKVALDFQKAHPDTLVVVTGDHETGGLSMGFADTGYALYVERLAHQTMSVGKFEDRVGALFKANPKLAFDDVKPLLLEAFGFKFRGPGVDENDPMRLHTAERKALREAFDHDLKLYRHKVGENAAYDGEKRYLLGNACRLVLSHKAGLGWSSGAHTAMPVLTTAQGPGAELFTGFIENTDLAKKLKSFYL